MNDKDHLVGQLTIHVRVSQKITKKGSQCDFFGISLTHYPIIALLRESHSLSVKDVIQAGFKALGL